MQTITIQAGNSDDKLTQKKWSRFVHHVNTEIVDAASEVHFSGSSSGDAPWQNYCWVVNVADGNLQLLRDGLEYIRKQHNQDSIAWTVGETQFV